MATIPRIIHQMWYSKDGRGYSSANQRYIDILKERTPTFEYMWWDNTNIHLLWEDSRLQPYRWLFDTISPHICKCDITRYAILYIYGGYYLDLDLELIGELDTPTLLDRDIVLFEERDAHKISNSIIGSRPGNGYWLALLRYIGERYQANQPLTTIDSVMETTGPSMLYEWNTTCGYGITPLPYHYIMSDDRVAEFVGAGYHRDRLIVIHTLEGLDSWKTPLFVSSYYPYIIAGVILLLLILIAVWMMRREYRDTPLTIQ